MTLSIASNIYSLSAQRSLQRTSAELEKTFERLSSGLRINSAADDPAGLAVADGLRADARIAAVATRNANDGLSATAIADSALNEIGGILSRMAELAEQSANGVYTATQRSALASEFVALGSEVARIANTTEFNDVELIGENSSDITLQVGLDSSANSQITVQGVNGSLAGLGLATAGSEALNYSIQATSTYYSQTASQLALDAVNSAISQLSSVRGTVGAAQSRLEFAVNNLTVARENFIAAESAIRDADVAQEVANLTRLQVLQQAATAVLAQANQQPSVALGLFQ